MHDVRLPTLTGRVVGHPTVQSRLVRAMERGQLHHALILVGPEGVGKATLARGLGCALHCRERPHVGCGQCIACRRVLEGKHVGVEWITPEGPGGQIKVAQARQLRERLQHAPFEGDAHLVVFDPADALNEQAYNVLLKSVEEPRPGVHFVMVTTDLSGLLPTILSRCMAIRMGRLDDDELSTILGQQSGISEIDERRRALAVRLAGGSAGVATDLALDDSIDETVALLGHAMAAAQAGPRAIFGGRHADLWAAWETVTAGPATGRPTRERAAARKLAGMWLLHLREHMRGREGVPGLPTTAHPVADLQHVQAFERGLERNPNVRLALEQTLLVLSNDPSA